MPKSNTFTQPDGETITFPGFTSRWTIPRSWASASASAMPSAISRARSGSSRPDDAMRLDSGSPITSSMTMNGVYASTPASWTDTMFGWASDAAARASPEEPLLGGRSQATGRGAP